jgi:small neutral amino acid transporter SnatA (MarC family)
VAPSGPSPAVRNVSKRNREHVALQGSVVLNLLFLLLFLLLLLLLLQALEIDLPVDANPGRLLEV